ncbi:MAG: DEAD/DEAH box helicase [Bacteroidota bacterium]
MPFERLNLIEPIRRTLAEAGYTEPTPIQKQTIPYILKGRDIIGCSQTGTGKTAAFALPILQNLVIQKLPDTERMQPRALVLSPTRELAIQIYESFVTYGKHLNLKAAVVYGGVAKFEQVNFYDTGVDILVATPGRLTDIMKDGVLKLDKVQVLVLDEADKMFELGFAEDLNKVFQAIPDERQTLFFSASMPPDMAKFAENILVLPIRVDIETNSITAPKIRQAVYFVNQHDKKKLLFHLIDEEEIESALIFINNKKEADILTAQLNAKGIKSMALHGKKSQMSREKALNNFKEKHIKILVATDVISRGIDVENLSHVINFDLPSSPESYLHRIGRTGRAGARGFAFSFCSKAEIKSLRKIEELHSFSIPVVTNHPFYRRSDFEDNKPTYNQPKRKQQIEEPEILPMIPNVAYPEPQIESESDIENRKKRSRIVKKDQVLITNNKKKKETDNKEGVKE